MQPATQGTAVGPMDRFQRIDLPFAGPLVLACGADLKNRVCLASGHTAVLSPITGDLAVFENHQAFARHAKTLLEAAGVAPAAIAHDLHPDYMSTRYALSHGDCRKVAVQHHHAHIASCMVEHGLTGHVIGVALDGTGYGTDGTSWGGEFLLSDMHSFSRAGHFCQFMMPGGDEAAVHPWRMGLSCIHAAMPDDAHSLAAKLFRGIPQGEVKLVLQMLHSRLRCPLSSSAGRLFDAVSAITGICLADSIDGHAAVELEKAAEDRDAAPYGFGLARHGESLVLDFIPAIRAIVSDGLAGVRARDVASRFHATVAAGIVETCRTISRASGITVCVLGGGVFNNRLLTRLVRAGLHNAGMKVYAPASVETGDAGIALGQAAVAMSTLALEQR